MNFQFGLIVTGSLALAVAAGVACSSSSGSSTPTNDAGQNTGKDSGQGSHKDAGTDAESFTKPTDADIAACATSATQVCALALKCNPTGFATNYTDGGCEARQQTNCVANLTAPGTAANISHTTSCAQAEMTESCADDLNDTPPSACNTLSGSGKNGSACSRPAQCASAFCAIGTASNCGTCQAMPSMGTSCTDLTTCGQGLSCVMGSCVQLVTQEGASCTAATPCGAGLDCVGAGDGGTGKCETEGTSVGAKCDSTSQTAPSCNGDLGYYCVNDKKDKTYETCQKSQQATAGNPCGRVNGVETNCVNSNCFKMGDAGYQCVAHASDTGDCNSLTGPACAPPARCIGTQLDGGTSGKCVMPGTYSCP